MAGGRDRLDQVMVARGLADSRARAQALVLAGRVRVSGQPAGKAGRMVASDAPIEIEAPPRFVSRGGEKLLAAIGAFGLSFEQCDVLDIGASTGGFADCALQHGARHVTCVDVGRAQLHDRLRRDPRVKNMEKVNARELQPGVLPLASYPRILVDVSFISLRAILPAAWPFLARRGILIALVKPQFEAGREEASRGRGVIRDEAVRQRVLAEIRAFAAARLADCLDRGAIDSPLAGAEGNREFLLVLEKRDV